MMSDNQSDEELWGTIDARTGTSQRSSREEVMLDVAHPDGRRLALPYSRISLALLTPEDTTADPPTLETLEFQTDTVQVAVEGWALRSLYGDLLLRRLATLETTQPGQERGPHVSDVRWEGRKGG